MRKLTSYTTLEEAYRGAINYYDGAFGQWINGLWGWTPSLPISEQKRIFLRLLERLLREERIVLSPPDEFWSEELEAYDTPTRPTDNFIGIWDIPINEQIAYIDAHFPKDAINANDEEVTLFFFDRCCPRIGWIHPETGKIVAS